MREAICFSLIPFSSRCVYKTVLQELRLANSVWTSKDEFFSRENCSSKLHAAGNLSETSPCSPLQEPFPHVRRSTRMLRYKSPRNCPMLFAVKSYISRSCVCKAERRRSNSLTCSRLERIFPAIYASDIRNPSNTKSANVENPPNCMR